MVFDKNTLSDFDNILKLCCKKYDFMTYDRGDVFRKSLSNVELFSIFCCISKYRPDCFFESGVWKGRSTIILLECLKYLNINIPYYVAATPVYKNLEAIKKNNSNLIVYECVGEVASKYISGYNNIGSLIDAPKLRKEYKKAIKLYNNLFKNNKVSFLFQHDIGLPLAAKRFYSFCKTLPNYESFILDVDFDDSCRSTIEPLRKHTVAKSLGAFLLK